MSKDELYYKALVSRDHRFDGKFFTGVKTTGIYCRPICPARPKRENVEFFPSALSAEKAGYRPCMRCRPESAPHSPAWIGKSAIVQRAIRLLHNAESSVFNEDTFAKQFGISARHLRRLFKAEVGKTPKQISIENRLNLARKLISETHLSLGEVAFASGFDSIRRFNDAFKDRFKKAPRQFRNGKAKPNQGLRIPISYRPPFDFTGLMKSYENHRVGDLERFEDGKFIRLVHFGGKVGQIKVTDDAKRCELVTEIDFPDTSAIHTIISNIKTMFDLNSDPIAIANSLEVDTGLKRLIGKYPGIRLPSGWDAFEISIAAILGQLVSMKMGRTLVADLIQIAGSDSGLDNNGKPIKLFPTPGQILAVDLTGLRTTKVRKQTIKDFSKAIAEGEMSLNPAQDVDAFIKGILKIRGIGPWTAQYIALKAIRSTDAFPGSDLILARSIKQFPKLDLQKTSPWRGYVAALLWREYSNEIKRPAKEKQ